MSWDETPKQSGGMYLKLEAGQSVKVVVRGKPEIFYVKWDGNKSFPTTKDDKDAKFRFYINVVVSEDGNYYPKMWEQGAKVFEELKALRVDYNLDETVLKITRTGVGKETKYSIIPLPNKLEFKTREEIAGIPLIDLAREVKGEIRGSSSDDSLPF